MRKAVRDAFLFVVALPLLVISRAPLLAAYTEPSATVAGGGGSAASANYSAVGVVAQPGVLGNSGSGSFAADHGFLSSLGGWHILYPVISATPGILTFTLSSGQTGSRPLALANSGGGTFNWKVARAKPSESYFAVSPSSGSGNATVTVTANAAGLAANSYTDTLTVSAAGAAMTVKVQLTLTVSEGGMCRLTMNIVSDTPLKGGGTVHSDTGGIACSNTGSAPGGMSGTCTAEFSPGTTVTLMQSPDSNATWATWSPPGCGTNESCQVTMNGDRTVTATFPYAPLAKVGSTGSRFDSLAGALTDAAASDTIFTRDATFSESLIVSGKVIKLRGGVDAWYQPQNARTTLDGKLSIRSGKLTVEKLVIK